MTIVSSQHRDLSSVKLWVLSKVVFILLNHALSASISTTEAVLQTQKHSETFVEKNIASYTWRNISWVYTTYSKMHLNVFLRLKLS